MKQAYYILILLFLVLFSCASSKSKASPKQIEDLAKLIDNKKFTIESTWAHPQVTNAMQQVLNSAFMQIGSNATSVNLIGNSNYLTISGDSISSYLPYFGERQMGVSYNNNDSAIQLNGLLNDYKVEKNKNESYTLSFQSRNKQEAFNTSIIIFPNLRSEIIINSSSRFPIRYSGNIISETSQ
ncbi:DUF4251 domain-containing protein [Algibacter aquimarinus]|uniref:DUF4251 domain-containing protein n=1 Tax=Algibacter aquimarinus TaxID=1136748 RepID=A0ABP9HEX7_9FLAO